MPLDAREGSITLDFAKRAGLATETIERYHTVDLAASSTYTPADAGLFSSSFESENLGVNFQDGQPTWLHTIWIDFGHNSVIGDGTNMQIQNQIALQRELVVMRHHLSTGTYERYNTQDLAASATYTPADSGLFSHASEVSDDVVCEYQYNATWWPWWNICNEGTGDDFGTCLAIGDGSHLRYRNTDGVNARWYVCMRAVMT
jgi:hypothetical protein